MIIGEFRKYQQRHLMNFAKIQDMKKHFRSLMNGQKMIIQIRGENIKNGEINLFLITVLFISIATKLYKGQWSWFIPEYNMLPEDKKKEYNKNKLCKAYSYCMIICALATFLLLLNEFFPSNILFAISCGLFVISMFFLIFWMLINNGGKKQE